jgi:hypothetical protein
LHALEILQRESILNDAQRYCIGNDFVPLQRDANHSTAGVARSTHANFHRDALVGVESRSTLQALKILQRENMSNNAQCCKPATLAMKNSIESEMFT